jgi:hypothetical protein
MANSMMKEDTFLKVSSCPLINNINSLTLFLGQALCIDVLEECYLILQSLRDASDADETKSEE